jgi:hypothetical protein
MRCCAFEQGKDLLAHCQQLLDQAELRVREIGQLEEKSSAQEDQPEYFPTVVVELCSDECSTAWLVAQLLKLPINYFFNKEWDWSILISPGGMPSSHTAFSTAAALGIGLQEGFGSSHFALAMTLATIVIYDAISIRRQAGFHAEWDQ